ncbi:MAG TPA: response regulator transcription factor [Candidatus Merdivicinus intestinavium]|nr:response regulator transcription factor [Candidatus Merdivicinus intestinavium]
MAMIYVVEDDENIRQLVATALQAFGYQVKAFENAGSGLDALKEATPDLMLFDLMLPDMDGVEAVRRIRADAAYADLPIMILTAKNSELDKVTGLDAGADDYLTKPFGILELKARVQALLRRTSRSRKPAVLTGQDLQVNCDTRDVTRNGEKIDLTFKEFELLKLLMENSERVMTRSELLNLVWGIDFEGETRTLDMHIRTLRQKLGDDADNPRYIHTVRGVGYRFCS